MNLAMYPPPIVDRYFVARDWLLAKCPELKEETDALSNVIGYTLGQGYKGTVCTLILSQKGLKLGLAYSATFPDPHGLLQGKGKIHRHVVIPELGPNDLEGLEPLLQMAITACKARLAAK